ncbi:MAG TPA: MATE family efflux transporter [Polyangiaceae bacterium]|nr:MATE family efflux transporter [Polyangiaceae bacterium]
MAAPIAASGVNVSTSGSPYRVVLRLATPTILAMLAQSAVNEIDIIFFARLPCPESSNAQAALLPSLILLWMFGGSLSAISVGTQAIAARRFAERRPTDAGGVLLNSWLFSLVSGIVFTLLGYLAMPFVLSALIKVPEVREAARGYLGWRLLGITSMAMTFSFKAFFDGIGKTYVHMVSSIVMNIINVVLCVMFIFGMWGAPRMGMAGAGFAGFVSTWVGLAIMIAWAMSPQLARRFEPFALGRWSRRITSDILRLSIPSAVATVAVMSGFALFSMIVSHLDSTSHAEVVSASCPGGHAEAVNSAATMLIVGILKLTFTACLAFGTSTATLVSQSLGEGDPDRATRFGWVSVRLGLVIFGVVGLLEGVVFTRPLLSVVTHSPAVLEAALGPMRLMGICTPLIATGMILTQALFGAGNTRFVMLVELVLHFLCLVPLAWLLGITMGFGLKGIWASATTYVVLLTAVMVWKFKTGDWRDIRL